ncbi:MAG: hypothetical protein ACOYL6_15930 [Bacteriovoracaceae bacterium]
MTKIETIINSPMVNKKTGMVVAIASFFVSQGIGIAASTRVYGKHFTEEMKECNSYFAKSWYVFKVYIAPGLVLALPFEAVAYFASKPDLSTNKIEELKEFAKALKQNEEDKVMIMGPGQVQDLISVVAKLLPYDLNKNSEEDDGYKPGAPSNKYNPVYQELDKTFDIGQPRVGVE